MLFSWINVGPTFTTSSANFIKIQVPGEHKTEVATHVVLQMHVGAEREQMLDNTPAPLRAGHLQSRYFILEQSREF